jgi:hypothetical protein
MLFCLAVSFVLGEEDSRLCFCFFMLRKKWGGNVYGIYAMAASGRMQYDYKQTNYRCESTLQPANQECTSERTWEHAMKCIRQFDFKFVECSMMYSIKRT